MEAGGIVNEARDTRILGTPRYVRTFTDNEYVALCMPFKVVGISDAYGDMNAWQTILMRITRMPIFICII